MDNLIKQIVEERNWLRRALGILTYHTLQQASREDKRGLKWTVQNTANVLGLSVGYISESLLIAKSLPKHREFTSISRDEALKILRQEKGNGTRS